MKRFKFLCILLIILATNSYASDGFKCVVKDARSPDQSGELKVDDFYITFVGKEFTVDRKTGKMLGALKNHEYYGSPKVLNTGSEKNSFRVITLYQPSVIFDYLTVETYNEKSDMPFIFVSSSTVVSGVCSSY